MAHSSTTWRCWLILAYLSDGEVVAVELPEWWDARGLN
jgi:hypothetical protein